MKLHLGCGKRNFGKEWKHIDAGEFPHVTSHDITKLPFGDKTCSIIYSSHVIQYFDRQEIPFVLDEWSRVLKSGGLLRLAVPDFKAMAEMYIESFQKHSFTHWPIESFLGPIYGRMKPAGCANFIYNKTAYDFISLKELLKSVGFCNVQLYERFATDHGHIDDHSAAYLPHMDFKNGTLISLNVEATKV